MTRPESDRVAVVSGGAQGIGYAIVEQLARDRYSVASLDIDERKGKAAAERVQAVTGSKVVHITCDVASGPDVQAAITEATGTLGPVTALVNNAGRNAYFDAVEMSERDWDAVFDVDLKAAWLLSKACLPGMLSSGGGAIVNISSIHGRQTVPGMFPYAAAKSGLEGLTRTLAADYGPRGIRVNSVAPGFTRTPLFDEWLTLQEDPAAALASVEKAHPLGYMAESEDVAAVVGFLLSPAARAVSGAVWAVDCGMSSIFSWGAL